MRRGDFFGESSGSKRLRGCEGSQGAGDLCFLLCVEGVFVVYFRPCVEAARLRINPFS
jgi:hypothetical protein